MVAILKWMALHVWILHTWFGMDLILSIWDSALSNILLVGICLALNSLLLNYLPSAGKFWFALGLSFALAWVCQWVVVEGMAGIAATDNTFVNLLTLSKPLRWIFDFVVIAGVSISTLFYYQLQEQEGESTRRAATQSMIKDAELQKLQLQLQPHFLFNSLNSINALILVKPEEARTMIQHLSDFLRTTIKRADEHWISFQEEWNYLQLYLEIEKVRFGHRLTILSSIDDTSFNWKIPTFLLQPLVENAIKFGLYGTTGNVTIQIEASQSTEQLIIHITNPFDPESSPKKGSGFGLAGIQRRLYLLFARNDLLKTSSDNNIFKVILKLPAAP